MDIMLYGMGVWTETAIGLCPGDHPSRFPDLCTMCVLWPGLCTPFSHSVESGAAQTWHTKNQSSLLVRLSRLLPTLGHAAASDWHSVAASPGKGLTYRG